MTMVKMVSLFIKSHTNIESLYSLGSLDKVKFIVQESSSLLLFAHKQRTSIYFYFANSTNTDHIIHWATRLLYAYIIIITFYYCARVVRRTHIVRQWSAFAPWYLSHSLSLSKRPTAYNWILAAFFCCLHERLGFIL